MVPKYGLTVARNVVIANMIGTGIFTSLGFQVMEGGIPNAAAILLVWMLGGLLALAGATCYAEVAATFQEDGGEYHFLSKLYHPILGIASGIVSIITGFSAAIASLALAGGAYVAHFSHEIFNERYFAVGMILLIAVIQWFGVSIGGKAQNFFTYIKVMLIAGLIALPLIFLSKSNYQNLDLSFSQETWNLVTSLAFPKALVWVMFAYSGWNAATYIVGHLKNPEKNLPTALLQATLFVTCIYVLINFSFMASSPFENLAGQVDIGNVVVGTFFPAVGKEFFSLAIAISLLAGINAMFIAGPRVIQKMSLDLNWSGYFSKESNSGAPRGAILVQCLISISFVLLSSFKEMVEYIGVSLTLFSMLVVAGVFIIRFKKLDSKGVKALLYPLSPVLFIGMGLWIIYSFAVDDPVIILYTVLTVLPAIILYFLHKRA